MWLALLLVAAGLVAVGIAPAQAATTPVAFTKSGPATTLVGEPVRYTLAAANPSTSAGGVVQFNLSFRDVLPAGVTYVPGSTLRADIGDPTVITDPDSGAQTLIWQDTFDLQAGSHDSISFQVVADPTDWPVQSTFSDTATAYGSTAPRTVPNFGPNGTPIPNPAVTPSAPSTATTEVAALDISKDEPSPEGKLLRGVHDQSTVYTLTVTNGDGAATDDAVVTDYLPASLEFLGCGGVDNSTTGPEYPGAPSLTATPAVGADCLTPSSVDTVDSPAGLPNGIYTAVTWNVGTLAPGQVLTIKYAAGVPLRQNTLDFAGGTPTPASLGQAANLDNNTGPTTRQNGAAVGVTNHVNVTGTYAGDVSPGSSPDVDVDASHTVTVNDLRLVKSVSPADFVGGDIATYSLRILSGEYVDNSDISVTDTIPNGICPLDANQNYVTGAPSDCDPIAIDPSVPYQSVTQNANGSFTVVFDPIAIPHNGAMTITYRARMRSTYTGGALAGEPTAVGDTFTNQATETATSEPRDETGESGAASITDSSSVTQTSSGGSLAKLVQPHAATQNCADNTYVDPTRLSATQRDYRKGDRICFEITATFAAFNDTLNSVLVDFLPLNTAYEDGSNIPGPMNTIPAEQVNFDSSGAANGALSWTLGARLPNGSVAVSPGAVFQVRFSVIVSDAAPNDTPLATVNIAKLRAERSDGTTRSLRARVPFTVEPAPPVSITKGVASINGLPAGGNPPNVDHQPVQEGDVVGFRVDVNNGVDSDVPIHSVQAWDVLAAGITCADVSAIDPPTGACTNPGELGQPSFAQAATRSAIVWNRPSTEVINPGGSATYTYSVTIPTDTSVDADLVDTASVRSFNVDNNIPGADTVYFPADNVDTTVDPDAENADAASDSSDVFIAPVAVTKAVASAVNEAGNVGGEVPPAPSTQATIGELVTYTVSADVPADATVFGGTLHDPMPTGLNLVSATAGFSAAAGTDPPTGSLPDGSQFDPATATLTLPPTFDNTSDVAVRFAVTIVARVTKDATNLAGTTRTNTATFTSNGGPGGNAPRNQTASSDVHLVEPKPSIRKTASPATVAGGQTVTYTLSPTNAAGASVLHDAWVVDCVPAGIGFSAYGTPTQGTTVAAAPGAGAPCAAGTTQLAWNVGNIAPATTPKLTYTAVVTPDATGKQTFTNTATLTGNSLAGVRTSPTVPGNPDGRTYSNLAHSTVTVLGASLQKSVDPDHATVGQTIEYTLTGILNANVSYFNATGIDTLPPGLDPASVAVVTSTCVLPDGTACPTNSSTILQPVPSGGSTLIGLYFGDVAANPQPRLFTIVYTVKVANVAAAHAGAVLTNSAHIAWNNTQKPAPTRADATFDQSSAIATAPLTVIEPSMSITKSVDDSTVEPGQVFHYTLRATNSAAPNTSPAFNATVTDTVPPLVVVDPGSISDSGVLTGADPTTHAGGTITWTIAGPIAVGASVPLGYDATLAPSGGLTSAQQVNRAVVASYQSLSTGGRTYPASLPATAPVTPVFPSVQATKSTPNGAIAYVGESFTWRIRLANSGAGTAYDVGASDVLPPNWTYDDGSALVSVNGATPFPVDPDVGRINSRNLSWADLADLAPGGALTITYTATPTPGVAGAPGVGLAVDHLNTVTPVAHDQTGATRNFTTPYAGDPASATAHIASADLELTKTVLAQPVSGRSGSWQVVVTNHGPDPATGPFTVTDGFDNPAPAGVTNIRVTGTGWSCPAAQPIVCQRTNPADTLASGASFAPLTITYDVAADVEDGTVLANSATVDARTFDPDLTDNADNARTTVGTSADLAVTKTLTSGALVAGQPATYDIAVTNLGPSVSAAPFTVTDQLPPTSTFVSVSAPGWTCAPVDVGAVGATVTCTSRSDLDVGGVRDIIVTVGVPASQTAPVTNTAKITDPTTPDPNPDNDTATVTNTPSTSADLAIQKRHIGTFVAGADQQYELRVHNNGPSDAADATITDTLPTGLTFLPSGSADWTCSADGPDVTCTHAAPIAAGDSTFVTLNVHLDPDLDTTQPVINVASVSSSTSDPNHNNNTDSDNTLSTGEADLAITKTHTASAVAGQPLAYTLHVTNNGPSRVVGPITVTDPLPAGLTYDTDNPAGNPGGDWTCAYAADTRLVTCQIDGGLEVNASPPDITLNVLVDPGAGPATIVNPADVASRVDDPDPTNNHTEDPTVIGVETAVALTKTLDTPTPVLAGTDATFTLQASNAGPSDAVNVTVTDTLPDHLAYVSAEGDGWTCIDNGRDVVCQRPVVAAVPPGAAVPPIHVVAQVDPATPVDADGRATLVNTATVDTSSPGTVVNPDPVPVPILARADLTLTKQASTDTPVAGNSFTWTLVAHNTGPSDAVGPLTVTDLLPEHETYLSTAAPWTCQAGAPPVAPTDRQDVTCTLSDGLAVGAESPPLALLVQLSADAPAGPDSNTATVSSPTPGENGTGTGMVTIRRTAGLEITKTHSGPGIVGQPLDFHLSVRNTGPSDADQLVVTDPLPTGLTYVSATGTDWMCSAAHENVTCLLAITLPAGASAAPITLTVRVGAPAYDQVTNVATVASTDPDLTDTATAEDKVIVDPDAVLGLRKRHVGRFLVGEQGQYEITVTNHGPTATPGPVRVTDPLPAGLTFVAAAGPGWTCRGSGATVSCRRAGPLDVGATSTIALTVAIGAAAGPAVTNTATAIAPGGPAVSAADTAPVHPSSGTQGQTGTRPSGSGPAATGADLGGPLGLALALLVVGAGLLLVGRSRRRRRSG